MESSFLERFDPGSEIIEPISKKWIRVHGKAQADSKAEHTRKYVSILNWFATPSWTLRHFLRWVLDHFMESDAGLLKFGIDRVAFFLTGKGLLPIRKNKHA
jgi:hypothetical protein